MDRNITLGVFVVKKPTRQQKQEFGEFHGPNLGYVLDLYEQYLQNPGSVDDEMKAYFQANPPVSLLAESSIDAKQVVVNNDSSNIETILKATQLAENIRAYGHLGANIYPLKDHPMENKLLQLDYYGLTKEQLSLLPVEVISKYLPTTVTNAYEAVLHLQEVYTGSIAYEFRHVHNITEKEWLKQRVESGSLQKRVPDEKRKLIYKRLTEVEEFEKFLHRTFVGQKRFSIEGLDAMVPLLDEMIEESVQDGARTINIGMAHRGRLNVLAHVLGKPYEMIFAEFQHAPNKELVPSEGSIGINYGWTGDVKYHLGLDRQIKAENTTVARLTLANNPSHLEFVGAVVEGFTRAAQDDRSTKGYPKEKLRSALAILIHGDAAFPGQGIVAETLNLSQLKGYRTGGTLHIIANNTIGFTTESRDSRSTRYSSDLAKGYEIPVLHVNADDPESCIAAAKLACEYRATFQKDFLIDLIGYRRFGHNEMDEPMNTNPLMYKIIQKHPTVKELYGKQLVNEKLVTEVELAETNEQVLQKLKEAHQKVPKVKKESQAQNPPETVEKGLPKFNTAVSLELLKNINEELLNWPSDYQVYGKLSKILERRRDALESGAIDWGLAETLAFASILADGTPVRLSGQDSERGTFAQRNIVLYDHETGAHFSPLHLLSTAKASFSVHNSPLSEGSVLGFEYGYNVFAPETLVLWEAQYGDFSNAAQVIFDQFISAGRAKWGQKSGLVILLPHGYEGQGPEHSSGRMERFLTLAAENNWTVANLTSAAQYFHILRRQAAILEREEVRPLVLLSPKSLLRHPLVASTSQDLTTGRFEVLKDEQTTQANHSDAVERIVIGTGKVMVDLAEAISNLDTLDWLHAIRLEQIYPFPLDELKAKLESYPNVRDIIWIQEEPKNMGAWTFVEPRLRAVAEVPVVYAGRRRRSSPAEGDPNVHKLDQARIISEALTRTNLGGKTDGRD